MILKMYKALFLAFNIFFLATACDDDDPITTLEDVNIVAQGECMAANVPDLNFTLCITDMDGNSKKSFSENDNFIISLSFENKSDEVIKIKKDYLSGESVMEVFRVENGLSHGKPYTSVWCQTVNNPYMIIEPGETFVVSSPWELEESIFPIGPICKAEGNDNLPLGAYQVEVRLQLEIEKEGEIINVNSEDNLILNFNVI